MIRSFVFSQGKLVSQDLGLDLLKSVLYDEDAQIWVDLEQPSTEEMQQVLEGVFGFHALAIEDCQTLSEQPKIDEFEGYLFCVIHGVDFLKADHEFKTTELNLFIGRNYLVTVHLQPMRSINATIDRILRNSAAVARASDRLTYTILDFLLDNYDPAMAELSTDIARIETDVVNSPSSEILSRVLHLKGEVQKLRQIMSPQREVIGRIARGEFKIIRSHVLPYYRDLLDRLTRINDLTEVYRDSLTNVLQVHLNMQQTQVNQIIKVLTVLATLTVPFLAITSFYGMNIRHMPNPEWPSWQWAYAFIFAITAVFTLAIFWFLKRQKWM